MKISFIILLIVLGQFLLALFYFSKPKQEKKSIKLRIAQDPKMVYVVPLLSWIAFVQNFNKGYSFLSEYSELIFYLIIAFTFIGIIFKNLRERDLNE